jgi:hypothetical protein
MHSLLLVSMDQSFCTFHPTYRPILQLTGNFITRQIPSSYQVFLTTEDLSKQGNFQTWKSKVSSQLKTSTKRPSWLPSALTDSVFPVPAGPIHKQQFVMLNKLSSSFSRTSNAQTSKPMRYGFMAITSSPENYQLRNAQQFTEFIRSSNKLVNIKAQQIRGWRQTGTRHFGVVVDMPHS